MHVWWGLIWDLLWFIFLLLALVPVLTKWNLEQQRLKLIARLERKRGSRVITLIHRQETVSFFGIAISRYIDIEDAEEVLRAIRLTDPNTPIDLIVHTPGGLVLAAEQIARALKKHKAKVTVFVPHYALSGGTLIALAADEIVMDENAVLGPVDPQIGEFPAASIIKAVERKTVNGKVEADDRTVILADIARKAINQVKAFVKELLEDRMGTEKAEEIAEMLSTGTWTHDYPITYEEAKKLGLPVSTDMPKEVYALMGLYPQTQQRRPSVWYIPMPYRQTRDDDRSRQR